MPHHVTNVAEISGSFRAQFVGKDYADTSKMKATRFVGGRGGGGHLDPENTRTTNLCSKFLQTFKSVNGTVLHQCDASNQYSRCLFVVFGGNYESCAAS